MPITLVAPLLALLVFGPATPPVRHAVARSTPAAHVPSGRMSPARRFPGRTAAGAARSGGTAQPSGSLSAPDGAGGQFVLWTDARDGTPGIYLLRVTNAGVAAAGWPAEGIAVASVPADLIPYTVLSDGTGGAFVVWNDDRDVYYTWNYWVQRVSGAGVPQWTANGVKLLDYAPNQYDLSFAPDGSGGLLTGWSSGTPNTDVFATRLTAAGALASGWTPGGTPVCSDPGNQFEVTIAADGSGGAVLAWQDQRIGNEGVYAQRMDGAGVAQWSANGIRIDQSQYTSYPVVLADPVGGAMVFWQESGDSVSVRGQKLDGTGATQWPTPGVLLHRSTVYSGDDTQAISDGSGGAIVAWESFDNAQGYTAQHVNSAGGLLWGTNGVTLVDSAGAYPSNLDLAGDGSGGGYFAWNDDRNGVDYDIYAQHVGSTGTGMWATNGIPVTTAIDHQTEPRVAPDGAGGMLVCFGSNQGIDEAILTQRFNAAGTALLPVNGVISVSDPGRQIGTQVVQTADGGAIAVWMEKVAGQYDLRARKFNANGTPAAPSINVCNRAGDQMLAGLVDDGAGGAIVAWGDQLLDDMQIHVQRLDGNATPQWTANGVDVCTAPGYRWLPAITGDGTGGVIMTWMDYRGNDTDLYGQRVSSAGVAQWASDGIVVVGATGDQEDPVITSDGAGGAIVLWSERRNNKPQLYGQRVNGAGALQWAADGLLIADYSPGQTNLEPIAALPATGNGALVLLEEPTWTFATNTLVQHFYLHRIDGAGVPQWGPLGMTVLDLVTRTLNTRMIDDGAGGAYLAWSDSRSGALDVYVQHVDATGNTTWTANGRALCSATGRQELGAITRAGSDVVLTWTDYRTGGADVYAHRVDANGADVWPANGRLVSGAAHGQYQASLAPWRAASPERFYVGWTDNRAGNERLAYAQRLDAVGAVQWDVNGTVAVTFALITADVEPGHVRLAWSTTAPAATVYRRTATGDWTALRTVAADGEGRILFDDRDVTAGERYAYRLGIASEGDERFSTETWVDVPIALVLALDGLTPNPASRDAVLSFTLPHAGPATLEWLDVTGRRVRTESVGALGAGRHTLEVGKLPSAGLYFLRLTQDGRTLTKRAAVVR